MLLKLPEFLVASPSFVATSQLQNQRFVPTLLNAHGWFPGFLFELVCVPSHSPVDGGANLALPPDATCHNQRHVQCFQDAIGNRFVPTSIASPQAYFRLRPAASADSQRAFLPESVAQD